jgi:hypothetical protein
MASHSYPLGETVIVTYDRVLRVKAGEQFQIIQLLPELLEIPRYRIRSEVDGHERLVREDQIDLI